MTITKASRKIKLKAAALLMMLVATIQLNAADVDLGLAPFEGKTSGTSGGDWYEYGPGAGGGFKTGEPYSFSSGGSSSRRACFKMTNYSIATGDDVVITVDVTSGRVSKIRQITLYYVGSGDATDETNHTDIITKSATNGTTSVDVTFTATELNNAPGFNSALGKTLGVKYELQTNTGAAYDWDEVVNISGKYVSVTAPTAFDNQFSLTSGTVTGNVMANDINVAGFTATLVDAPELDAGFTLGTDGSFTYTVDASVKFTKDFFTYEITDGTTTKSATITITNPDAKLVAKWDFDQVAGNTLPELSPTHANGTVTGTPTWSNGALVFSGDDEVTASASAFGENIQALAISFKLTTAVTSSTIAKTALINYDDSHKDNTVCFGPNTGAFDLETLTMAYGDYLITSRQGILEKTISTDKQVLVINWNSSTSQYDFYLDGTLQDTSFGKSAGLDHSMQALGDIILGNSVEYDNFVGEISGLAMYNAPLTTDELNNNIFTPAIGLEVVQDGSELSWTVADEIGVKEYQVVDAATGEIIEVVVAGKGSYSTTLSKGVEAKLVVVDNSGYAQTFLPADGNIVKVVYDLKEGWNLIAIPGDNADTTALEKVIVGDMWAWNGAAYETAETPAACQGIWVYAPKAVQTIVTTAKSDAEITLQSGWNLVGPKENIEVPEAAHTVYGWKETYQNIATEDGILIQGIGYWIFSL